MYETPQSTGCRLSIHSGCSTADREKIENDIHPPPHHCQRPRGWNVYNCEHGTMVYVPRRCRACIACAEAKISIHACRIRYGLDHLPPSSFLTVTTRPGTEWQDITGAWTSFVYWLRKRQPDVQYAAAREIAPDNGMRHMHVVLAPWAYMPQSALSMAWSSRVSSPVVWIERTEKGRAIKELSKYLSKATPELPRAINYSRGWPKQPPPEKLEYQGPSNMIDDDEVLTACTKSGYLVGDAPSSCKCFSCAEPITDGERAWLAYRRDLWYQTPQAALPA